MYFNFKVPTKKKLLKYWIKMFSFFLDAFCTFTWLNLQWCHWIKLVLFQFPAISSERQNSINYNESRPMILFYLFIYFMVSEKEKPVCIKLHTVTFTLYCSYTCTPVIYDYISIIRMIFIGFLDNMNALVKFAVVFVLYILSTAL